MVESPNNSVALGGSIAHGTLDRKLSSIGVIMAGGSGTRFWPLSRGRFPKQFLSLEPDGESLIQTTAHRLEPLCSQHGVLVVTSAALAPLVRQHLPSAAILMEPMPRNTAACVGYAAAWIKHHVGDVPMVVVPADHVVRGNDALLRNLRLGIELARSEDILVTIGIQPTHPETGYGYIQRGEAVNTSASGSVYAVRRFVEKPDVGTAREYLAGGDFLWNSGMFVWRPSSILAAINKFLPKLGEGLREIRAAFDLPSGGELVQKLFSQLESVSIDVGVMERASNTAVIPATGFEWSDVGSWDSWVECLQERADLHGNLADGDAIFVDSERASVLGNKKLVTCIGMSDVIVVETDDALLVCHRDHAQGVKRIVETLRQRGRSDLL